MADRDRSKPVRTRRRPVQAVDLLQSDAAPSLAAAVTRYALSGPAKIAYAVVGTVGLAALAVAVIGPKRLEQDVLKPLRGAIEPQAEKLWAEAAPLRDQIAGLLENATPRGRARLARSFQSWIGHFHAT